jgi:hypothetical protein
MKTSDDTITFDNAGTNNAGSLPWERRHAPQPKRLRGWGWALALTLALPWAITDKGMLFLWELSDTSSLPLGFALAAGLMSAALLGSSALKDTVGWRTLTSARAVAAGVGTTSLLLTAPTGVIVVVALLTCGVLALALGCDLRDRGSTSRVGAWLLRIGGALTLYTTCLHSLGDGPHGGSFIATLWRSLGKHHDNQSLLLFLGSAAALSIVPLTAVALLGLVRIRSPLLERMTRGIWTATSRALLGYVPLLLLLLWMTNMPALALGYFAALSFVLMRQLASGLALALEGREQPLADADASPHSPVEA